MTPCWYCSGLVRQFKIGTVVVGESMNFDGGIEWLRENGVNVINLNSKECKEMLGKYIKANSDVWNERYWRRVEEKPYCFSKRRLNLL